MVPNKDNLMLAEDGTKLPCNGIYNSYWHSDPGHGYKNSRAILLKQMTWAETWSVFSCLGFIYIVILIFLSIIVTDILEENFRM